MLLAYDDSVPAKKAVEFLMSLALGDRAEIKVLSVLALIKMYRQDIRQQLNWVWVEKKQKARRLLEAVSGQLRSATPLVTTELVESADVSQSILDAGSAMQSDLMVLGHKGKGAVERFLVGSVTARVAHHACCSVLAVRK
jgi:nucleotide-binding universal stress UspA family protein